MTGQIVITSRAEAQLHLYQSSLWEVQGFLPVRGKRVKRKAKLPVWLPDARFAPRRAAPAPKRGKP